MTNYTTVCTHCCVAHITFLQYLWTMSSQCPYMFMSVEGSPYLVELCLWEFGCVLSHLPSPFIPCTGGGSSYTGGSGGSGGSGKSKFGSSDRCPRCGGAVYMAEKIVGAGSVSRSLSLHTVCYCTLHWTELAQGLLQLLSLQQEVGLHYCL